MLLPVNNTSSRRLRSAPANMASQHTKTTTMTQQQQQTTTFRFGHVGGLDLSLTPSALWSMAAMWIGLSAVGMWLLDFGVWTAILGGLLSVMIHWLSDFWHQYGHAIAARRTGYPMIGLRFWGIFSTSLWPADEPALPGRFHIRRALGGPIASILLGALALAIAVLLGQRTGLAWWLALFAAADNLLLLGFGAFLPLGFTDGSTILHWWHRR